MNAARDALRDEMRSRRNEISMIESAMHSIGICERILALPEYQKARRVMAYYAKPREVQTSALLRELLRTGRTLYLPRILPGRHMEAAKVLSLAELRLGPYDIMQPEDTPAVDPADIELILIPGLAFDAAGGRLGHGAGYYDRFLPSCRGLKVALAYDMQLVRHVPVQPHDAPMDLIITQSQVYDCRKARQASTQ